MKRSRCLLELWVAVTTVALALAAFPVFAQDQEQGPAADPPVRVARLSFLYGSVSFQPAGENDWVAAVANRPLTTGDSLWVDAGGRAELHVGSTAIRLGQSTGITLLEVSDHILQIRLAQGSMILHTRHVDEDDAVEADTPNLAFSVLAPGEYRLDVNADGTETSTSVVRGQGQVNGGGRAYTVVAGQQAHFSGLDSLTYEISPVPATDPLDNWANDRDRREEHSQSANYVSREVTGYEDLDAHGQWSVAAGYGPVWTPVGVPYGWAPYRYGHWAWIEPWGWTWVDDQPWGFAPFHYGRWAFVGTGWVWVPGPVVVRPVYAPALVAFVGGGPGGGFALTVGGGPGVGWFPLGPGEVFVPAYRVSRVYVTNVNITNTRVETTQVNYVYNAYTTPGAREVNQITYANRTAPGAVTVVTRETFVGARPVARNVVTVNNEEIARAPVTHMAAVAPARTSVMGAGAPAASAPPAAMQQRKVISNRTPAAPPPSFSERQAALNAHPGQPPARNEVTHSSSGKSPFTERALPTTPPTTTTEPIAAPPAQSGAAPANPPAPAPRTYERVEPSPPAGPNTPTKPATQPTAQSPSQPAAQPTSPPKPKTAEEPRAEEQKAQKPPQQQQQQQKSQPQKSNKPSEKDKEKEKPNPGKP